MSLDYGTKQATTCLNGIELWKCRDLAGLGRNHPAQRGVGFLM